MLLLQPAIKGLPLINTVIPEKILCQFVKPNLGQNRFPGSLPSEISPSRFFNRRLASASFLLFVVSL